MWPVMMDDSAPIHERRKLVKTYKMCSLENRLWLLNYAGRSTPKNDNKKKKSWSRKTATDVINPAKMGNQERERGREDTVWALNRDLEKSTSWYRLPE